MSTAPNGFRAEEHMGNSRRNHDNFPVASILMPAYMRHPVRVVYRFARTADDIADEGHASPTERYNGIAGLRRELDAIKTGTLTATDSNLMRDLSRVIMEYSLDIQWFYDLLASVEADIAFEQPMDLAENLEYARLSANPIGRILLRLCNDDSPTNVALSDNICTALQLIDFWQDIETDWRDKGRIYIPRMHMVRFGVTQDHLNRGIVDARWKALMRFEVCVARDFMLSGAPLTKRLKNHRFQLELQAIMAFGLRILDLIEKVDYDVFRVRPVLGWRDQLGIFSGIVIRACLNRTGNRGGRLV
ncbi:squalene synthase HpnC [Burkholderia orbicola]|uniref:squalene synthase HpnC n=1 Tax=Burkholderia orbicola TaxID=2978683 RepID=UPI002FE3C5A9